MAEPEPLLIDLEFARAQQTSNPFAFSFAPQEYLLRSPGGRFNSALLDWSSGLFDTLTELRLPGRDATKVQHLGELLREFLTPLEWGVQEAQLLDAVRTERRVLITFRSAAAELYTLPWELLTLKSTGQHLGELPNVLLRYEWPDTQATAEPTVRPEGGRILLAWSAAGGAVPAAEHVVAIQAACRASSLPFDATKDVISHTTCDALVAALAAAVATAQPISVLHLLCHGSAVGNTFGLALDSEDSGDPPVVVDAGRLRQLLAPYAAQVRLVVLSACDSGNSGTPGNELGSIAQTLHRAGFAQVVASRFPLSVSGAIRLVQGLYNTLLGDLGSVESAVLLCRAALAQETTELDWASLQLYAHAATGADSRPIIFRPYRGLLSFQPEHRRLYFGRDRETAQIVDTLAALTAASKPRLLVVAGASGTGKSSVVLAGAVPRLLEAKGAAFRLVRMRPGSTPEKSLDVALQASPGAGPLLLVVDQFEELFTQTQDAAARQAYAQRLWALASDAQHGHLVILTVRVDFLGRCGEITLDRKGQRLDHIVYDAAHRVFITQLQAEALRVAIEAPARLVGLQLEPGLVQRLIQDVGAEPGGLPLLQDTLDLLWQKRQGQVMSQQAYQDLGGLTGALQGRADALIDSLDAADQRLCRRLLVRLVNFNLDDDTTLSTRQRIAVDKVRPDGPAAVAFERVLGRLLEARLLVSDGTGAAQFVEVAHEALIRKWQRLQTWVREDRKMLAALEKLEGWAEQQQKFGALLVGNQLGYAVEVSKEFELELPGPVRLLLDASFAQAAATERQATRQRWIQRAFLVVSMATAVLSVGLTWLGLARRTEIYQQLLSTYVEKGWHELRQDRPIAGLLWLEKAYQGGSTAAPMLPYLLAEAMQPVDALRTTLVHPAAVTSAAFSSDGRHIFTVSADGLGRLFQTGTKQPSVTINGQGARVHSGAFSPDGNYLIMVRDDQTAGVWKLSSGQFVAALRGHQGAITAAAFSPDSRLVVTASDDNTARLWETQGGQPLQVLKGHTDHVTSAAFSPDGRRIVTASLDYTVQVWEVSSGRPLRKLLGDKSVVDSAAFSPDGHGILTTSADHSARIWDSDSGETLATFKDHEARITSAAFSRDGHRVVTASEDHTARIWEADTGSALFVLKGSTELVTSAAFSADGSYVVTASTDNTTRLWAAETGRLLTAFIGHGGRVNSVAFSPDGLLVLTSSADHTARLWVTSRPQVTPLIGHRTVVKSAVFSPDASRVLTADESTVRIWEATTGRSLSELVVPQARILSAVFSADGRRVLTADHENKVRTWEVSDGHPSGDVQGAVLRISAAAFSPDRRRIVVASEPDTALIWDTSSGTAVATLTGHGAPITSVAFSADGRHIVTASEDQTTRIWDASSGRQLKQLPVAERRITSAAFSPGGQRIVIAHEDDTASLWDAQRGRQLVQLTGHTAAVTSVAFSPDGKRIVTASSDKTVRIWDAASGQAVAVLTDHAAGVNSAVFSADSKYLVTASWDNTARIWAVGPETRSAPELAARLRCRLSYKLDGNVITATQPEPAACK